jgi:Na+/glutamate symporter
VFDDLLGTLAGDVSVSYDPNSGLSAGLNGGAGQADPTSVYYTPAPAPAPASGLGISSTTLGLIIGGVVILYILNK